MRIEERSERGGARYTVGARIDDHHIARRATQCIDEPVPLVNGREDVTMCPTQYHPKVRLEWCREKRENVKADGAHVSGKCTFVAENAPVCPVRQWYLGL